MNHHRPEQRSLPTQQTAASPRTGQVIGPVRVGPIAHGGHHVARMDDRVIFVRHSIEGELVMVKLTDTSHARFWRGDAVEILEASDQRVAEPCPVAGICGGCDFQHITIDAQARLKEQVIAEQLHRLAHIDIPVHVERMTDHPDGLGWRTRMRYLNQHGKVGLRAHRREHLVELPGQGCLIADHRGPSPDELADFGRDPRAGHELVVATAASGASVLSEGRVLSGEAVVTENIDGARFKVAADGFWQVHSSAAETLTKAVMHGLDPQPGQVAWDLYCGVGVFAGALAKAGCDVSGVEANRKAIEHARINVPSARFMVSRVEKAFNRLPEHPDLVVLDPPRSGAGKQVVKAIGARAPHAVAYVACDPAALARDLASFTARGYQLTSLRAFDIFPMTQHVEALAILTPSN